MSKIIQNKSSSVIVPSITKVKRSDFQQISFFAKQFCLPKQIKLVEYNSRSQMIDIRQNIQIVDRANSFDSNPIFRNITPINFTNNPADPGDGLISLVKNLNVRIAICITVYSQQKNMLKRTLQGIKNNYQTFFQKAGVHSHEIAIVVMFDGIQYLNNCKQTDKNMLNLFRQFDLINGFRKKQYLLAKQKQSIHDIPYTKIQDDSLINDIQNFADQMMFTQQQYQALQTMLLQNQYNRYKSMSELLQFADDIQNKKLYSMSIDSLPTIVKQAFIVRARQYLQENGIEDITDNNKQLQDYIVQNLPQEKIDILKIDALKKSVFLAKDYLKSRANTAIMYQMTLPLQKKYKGQQDPKMNLFTVVKYQNRGKLSSHLWFFQGFCNMINPSVCILLDCGLEPQKDSIFKVWAHIETYKKTCGGVCGYMKLRSQSPYDQSGNRPQAEAQSFITMACNTFFDVQKAQIFQYHLAHLLDKPFQSLTGYIHVLPGAFSGYNWDALRSQRLRVMRTDGQVYQKDIQKRTKQQILKKYLKTVIYNQILDNIQQANMYLAQDRILCLQIFTKKNNQFNLQYLPDAYAQVDPVTTLPKLLNQRKRWINGSWFALNYVLRCRGRVAESSHNRWEKLWFYFNMFNAQIMKYVSYLSMAFLFVTFHLMVLQFAQTTIKDYFLSSYHITQKQLTTVKVLNTFLSVRSIISSIAKVFDFIYIACISLVIYRSLTLKKQDTVSKRSFNTIATFFGLLGIITTGLIFYNFYQALFQQKSNLVNIRGLNGLFTQKTFIYLLVSIVGIHSIIVFTALSFSTYWEIVTSTFSYFFFAPAYINLFFIYAFCRIDDLSWGTKGLDTETKSKQLSIRKKFSDEKISFFLTWISSNVILSIILIGLSNNFAIQNYIIWIFSAYFAVTLVIKLIFVIIYLLQYYIVKRIKVMLMIDRNKQHYMKQSKKIKDSLKRFIDKMKQQQIDVHVQQINQQLIKKRIENQAWKNQRNRLIQEKQSQIINRNKQKQIHYQNGNGIKKKVKKLKKINFNKNNKQKQQTKQQQSHQSRKPIRLSFNDLKKISNLRGSVVKSKFTPQPHH